MNNRAGPAVFIAAPGGAPTNPSDPIQNPQSKIQNPDLELIIHPRTLSLTVASEKVTGLWKAVYKYQPVDGD